MRYYCTYFDRNYLARALALFDSLERHEQEPYKVLVVCLDELTRTLLAKLAIPNLELIPLHELEAQDPALIPIRRDRTLVEYYWTMTPTIILRLLDRVPPGDPLIYLDADLFFFSTPDPLFAELEGYSALIHEHRFSPALAYLQKESGRFNVGLLGFRNDGPGREVLGRWREQCLAWCFNRYEDGKMGDQMYLDEWPSRFPCVKVMEHPGGGVAPWNHDTPGITLAPSGEPLTGGQPIIFFHFQALTPLSSEVYLPSRHVAYPMPLDSLRACYLPYIATVEAWNQEIRRLLPHVAFGYWPDLKPTQDHTIFLRGSVAAGIAPKFLLQLGEGWSILPGTQAKSEAAPGLETCALLWRPGRKVVAEDDLLMELQGRRICGRVKTIHFIGAHLFQERDTLHRLFPALGRVYLYEPLPPLAEHLAKQFGSQPGIAVFPYAITDQDGTAVFHVASNNGASSSLLPMGRHLEVFPGVKELGSIQVQTRRLATVIKEHQLEPADLLLVDVQGAEFKVLSSLGREERLAIKLIYTEASTEPLYEGSRTLEELRRLLEPDFTFAGFAPLTDRVSMHGNALFVRSDLVQELGFQRA